MNRGRQLPAPVDHAVGDEVPAAYDFVGDVRIAIGNGEHNVEMDQQRQKSYADCCRCDMECQVGEEDGILRMAPGARKLQPK